MAKQVILSNKDRIKLKKSHEETRRQVEFNNNGVLACQMNVQINSEGGRKDGLFRFKFRADTKEVHDIYIHYIDFIGEETFKIGYSRVNYYLEKSHNFSIRINPQFVKQRHRKYIHPTILKFFPKE